MAAYLIYECEYRERVGSRLLDNPVWYKGNWYEAMMGTCEHCHTHPEIRGEQLAFSVWQMITEAQEEGVRKLEWHP